MYYLKNGFKFLTEKDFQEKTRLMYFDLRGPLNIVFFKEKMTSLDKET
jgi:hypothetical protein